MTDCQNCDHPKKSHRYGGANVHGRYTYLSSCRLCGCGQFEDEDGPRRRDLL